MENTFNIGDWVTIVRWVNSTDRSWCGKCLKIQAITWPFIVVSEFQYDRKTCGPFALNFAEVELIALDKEYVEAMNPKEAVTR